MERIWDGISIMEFQPLPTKEQIVEKMNGLRTYFNVQRNKMESSKESGTSTDAVYKSKWQFYESLLFLQDMVTPRRTFSNMDDDDVNAVPFRINGPRRPRKTVENIVGTFNFSGGYPRFYPTFSFLPLFPLQFIICIAKQQ